MDHEQTDRAHIESAAQTAAPAKKSRRNGNSASLLKGKHMLDAVVAQLGGFPELQAEASTLRDKLLTTLLEHERSTGLS